MAAIIPRARLLSLRPTLLFPSQSVAPSSFCSCRFSSTSTTPSPPTSSYTLPKGLLLNGIVVTTGKMAQTITVRVERKATDHRTLKEFKKHKKYLVHDPAETSVVGDQVAIRNCLPVSRRKAFELVEITRESRDRAGHNASESAPAQA